MTYKNGLTLCDYLPPLPRVTSAIFRHAGPLGDALKVKLPVRHIMPVAQKYDFENDRLLTRDYFLHIMGYAGCISAFK